MEKWINKSLYDKIYKNITEYLEGDLEERYVLAIAAVLLDNPVHNEKHLHEILGNFKIVDEHTIAFHYLGLELTLYVFYKQESDLPNIPADYTISLGDKKLYVFNSKSL